MAKTLLIGANSTIAKALQEISDREFVCVTRSEGTLNLEGDLSELDDISDINGLVYFPGTINLKPFTMLKEDDFLNDFKINAAQNRVDSQFLVLGGLGSIIIGSSMSAFFAIERNTRKKED